MIIIKIILKSAQLNKLKLTENYYIQKAGTLRHTSAGMLAELWAHISCYTKFITLCWSHITMCWSQYHDVSCESCLLDLEQSASVFCYNYFSLKKNIHVSTAVLQRSLKLYFMSVILNVQWLLLNQIISDFSV